MPRSALLKAGSVALAVGALSACSMVPVYQRPTTATPDAWSAPHENAGANAAQSATWWRRFGSSELDDLIAAALRENHDLGASRARIIQARAQARIAGAALLPGVDAAASVTRSRNNVTTGTARADSSSQGLLSANYELDLWDANQAGAESAGEALKSSIYDRDALALVVQSQVATTYFQALALADRLAIARHNLRAATELLQLVQAQYRRGATSELELAQQRSAVATYQAQIPALARQRAAALHSLAVLTGRPPEGFTIEAQSLASLALPAVAAGQPSALLERRPDIMAAEASLRAANADVGAARAALLPSVTLTASAGATGLVTAGSATVVSLAAGLVAPLFEGGKLRGSLEQAQGRTAELAQNYQQTVLQAFGEVEDALVTVQTSAAELRALTTAATEASRAYHLAMTRYRAGSIDFITVIDAERSQLQAEDSRVQARYSQYAAATSLFKALGGGWQRSG